MDGHLSQEIMERMRVPPRHWGCTLAKIPEKCQHKGVILLWLARLVENVKMARGLMLVGDYSQGKSAIAAIILKAAAMHGLVGLWVRARELPKFIIEKTPFDQDQTMVERAESVPLLVIDELQIRAEVAYIEQTVESLVRWRIDNGLCTVLTTNHSASDLKTKYPALTAALLEAVKPVVIRGHDFRVDRDKEWTL